MGAVPQKPTLITPGVDSLARARAFDNPDVAFFDMNGVILSSFWRAALAEDAQVPVDTAGFRDIAPAINLDSETAVGSALTDIAARDGRITKPAQEVFWGGYTRCFAGPDGNLWELGFNLFWPLDATGRPQLPPS